MEKRIGAPEEEPTRKQSKHVFCGLGVNNGKNPVFKYIPSEFLDLIMHTPYTNCNKSLIIFGGWVAVLKAAAE